MLKRLFGAYKTRFHEQAPAHGAQVPFLMQKRLDVVAVNGARVLHFFFSEPDAQSASLRQVTRLHAVTAWPPTAQEQKEIDQREPQVQRDLVRRAARIRGELYVHFVLYPEDGGLSESIAAVGERLAQREVARAQGEALPSEVPAQGAVRGESPKQETGSGPVWDPGLDPAP